MKTVTSAMSAHLQRDVTSLCTLWRIERVDGEIMAFTDLDEDLTFQGVTYKATGGYERTAVASDSSLSVDNLDVTGVINAEDITEADLRNGVYDYAAVEMMIVNWADLSMGAIKIRRGWFGEVTLTSSGMFKVELRGLTQLLSLNFGLQFTPECSADLSDKKCGVQTLSPLRQRKTHYPEGAKVRSGDLAGSGSKVYGPVPNVSFDADPLGARASLTGWVVEQGRVNLLGSQPNGFAPRSGDKFMEGYDYLNVVSHTVDLLDVGIGATAIDAEQVQIDTRSSHASRDKRSLSRKEIIFLDADDEEILEKGYDSGEMLLTPLNQWFDIFSSTPVPPGARKIKIRLTMAKPNPAGPFDFFAAAPIDDLVVSITDASGTDGTSRRWGNCEFIALNEGTTEDAVSPTVPLAAEYGATFTDGGVTWRCVPSRFFFASNIDTVESRRAFTLTFPDFADAATGAAYPDHWFDFGVLTFESGPNKGRRVEIKSWLLASRRIEIEFAAYFDITPTVYDDDGNVVTLGDAVSFYAGCNKDRLTCFAKFNNIVNFRGFADVPGNEFFIRQVGAG